MRLKPQAEFSVLRTPKWSIYFIQSHVASSLVWKMQGGLIAELISCLAVSPDCFIRKRACSLPAPLPHLMLLLSVWWALTPESRQMFQSRVHATTEESAAALGCQLHGHFQASALLDLQWWVTWPGHLSGDMAGGSPQLLLHFWWCGVCSLSMQAGVAARLSDTAPLCLLGSKRTLPWA